jgi:hypothetical protein
MSYICTGTWALAIAPITFTLNFLSLTEIMLIDGVTTQATTGKTKY